MQFLPQQPRETSMEHADQPLCQTDLSEDEILRANARGKREQSLAPVVNPIFVAQGDLCLEFSSGVRAAIPLALIDLLISALLSGIFGTRAWMSQLSAAGRLGGTKTSVRKAAAARENGKRGGRPSVR
jgi:hypothetical protein